VRVSLGSALSCATRQASLVAAVPPAATVGTAVLCLGNRSSRDRRDAEWVARLGIARNLPSAREAGRAAKTVNTPVVMRKRAPVLSASGSVAAAPIRPFPKRVPPRWTNLGATRWSGNPARQRARPGRWFDRVACVPALPHRRYARARRSRRSAGKPSAVVDPGARRS
jgi:hypothetical protein